MRWGGRKRRSTGQGSRVRFANERKRSVPRKRATPSLQRFAVSRDDLFGFYVLIFCGPLLLVVAGAVAIFAHDVALPSLFYFVVDSFVYGINEIWKRPTLFLAFLFVLSVIWCLSDSRPSSNGSRNFRRGRDLGGLDDARRLSKRYAERRPAAGGRR